MTDINAVARRVQYSGNNPADAGPFSFTFQVNATTEVNVFVDGTLKTLSTHYTVTLSSSGAGSVSFTSGNFPTNTQTVTISSNVGLARSSVYTTGGPLTAAALEKDFDTQQMILQQVSQKVDRALAAPENDATNIDMTLPVKADRLGKYLAFNSSTGNPEIGPDTASVTALASITAAVNLLGTSAVVEDMGLLATSAVIEDMGLLATSANVTAMGLLGVSGVITDMGILGTAAIVEDMGILGTSANVTAMGLLGTAAVVEDMGLLSASAVITDMDLLGTSANVTAMGILGTSANVTAMAALSASAVVADMALLGTTDVIADMALLANSDVISDLNTLATSDIVSDLNTLATSDIVSDINTLATSDIVSDLNTLATSDIVTDINLLATSAIVADLNLLATSDVIADMASLAGSGGSPNISAISVSGNANVAGEVQTTKIAFTDGDDAMTITDTGLVEFNTGFNIGSDAAGDILYNNGSKYVRLAKGTDGQALVLASGIPSWAAVSTDISGKANLSGATFTGDVNIAKTGAGDDTTLKVASSASSGDNDATVIIGNGGTGDSMLRFDYESNTDRARIGVTTSDQKLRFFTAGANERMLIDNAGKVGIGTSSPSNLLHIQDSTADSVEMKITNTNADAVGANIHLEKDSASPADNDFCGEITFVGSNDNNQQPSFGSISVQMTDVSDGSEDGAMLFKTSSGGTFAERMRLDNSGNLGIGTTSPARKVAIESTGNRIVALKHNDGDHAYITFQDTSTTNDGSVRVGALANDLILHSGDNERFRVGSAGQFGIGGATYGTSGQVLTSGGASAAPTWADAGGGAHTVVSDTTYTNATSIVFTVTTGTNYIIEIIDMFVGTSSGASPYIGVSANGGTDNYTQYSLYGVMESAHSSNTWQRSTLNGSTALVKLLYGAAATTSDYNGKASGFHHRINYYQRSGDWASMDGSYIRNEGNYQHSNGLFAASFRAASGDTDQSDFNRIRIYASQPMNGRVRLLTR